MSCKDHIANFWYSSPRSIPLQTDCCVYDIVSGLAEELVYVRNHVIHVNMILVPESWYQPPVVFQTACYFCQAVGLRHRKIHNAIDIKKNLREVQLVNFFPRQMSFDKRLVR